MKLIIVPVADRPECAKALDAAFRVGERVSASVKGCHMRPHRYSEVSMSTAFADAAWRKKSTKKAPAAAKTLYERCAEAHGYDFIRSPRSTPGALWSERVGSPGILMSIIGPVSDLVVVSRPRRAGGVADMFMQAALTESSAPVLIVPQRGRKSIGKRIVIAWNQSPEVARTVASALPLLAAADEVTFVSAGDEDRPGPKSGLAAGYLKHYGIRSKRMTTDGRHVEPELLDAYQELDGDLMIAGAYSRSRWREKVFGGTTEFLMRKARLPVLMKHG